MTFSLFALPSLSALPCDHLPAVWIEEGVKLARKRKKITAHHLLRAEGVETCIACDGVYWSPSDEELFVRVGLDSNCAPGRDQLAKFGGSSAIQRANPFCDLGERNVSRDTVKPQPSKWLERNTFIFIHILFIFMHLCHNRCPIWFFDDRSLAISHRTLEIYNHDWFAARIFDREFREKHCHYSAPRSILDGHKTNVNACLFWTEKYFRRSALKYTK